MEGELLIDFGGSKVEKDDGWGNSWDDDAWESLNKDDQLLSESDLDFVVKEELCSCLYLITIAAVPHL